MATSCLAIPSIATLRLAQRGNHAAKRGEQNEMASSISVPYRRLLSQSCCHM